MQGFRTHIVYFARSPKPELESFAARYSQFLESIGEAPLRCTRAADLGALLQQCDVVSLHTALSAETRHLIGPAQLRQMKPNAILVNTARGAVIDESALVAHLRANPNFVAALDVYEHEPKTAPGLLECPNTVLLPHIGSATAWTRNAMAVLASLNIAHTLRGLPIWPHSDFTAFVKEDASVPPFVPSLVNRQAITTPKL
eukprot:TRINITY_DN9273_c0_g1_i2.p2 TRINITY_DN9273_c0_g1~~TRINITY_DN9273_c0_g1_i2.p2  ORF type:complete len:200 (-),score=40.93 TRINITY_DN9273_c0_g1_i2:6-605(-)